jgi:hypothetical protein
MVLWLFGCRGAPLGFKGIWGFLAGRVRVFVRHGCRVRCELLSLMYRFKTIIYQVGV